jgi:DNA-binding NarL/FixJ family response regulator
MIVIDIVEDHSRLADTLRASLSTVKDFEVRSVFASAERALSLIPAAPPNVVIVDLNLPKMNGVELISRLRPICPDVQFLVLTMYEDTELIFDALKAGATGYLLKRDPREELTDAIRQIAVGGAPMSPAIARRVVQSFQQATPSPVEGFGLSLREQEVLELLSRGDIYKEIGDQLSISIDTVRSHIRKIYEKLEVHSRAQAVAKFRESPGVKNRMFMR